MKGPRESRQTKLQRSGLVLLLILIVGVTYQYFYHERKARYRAILAEDYRKYTHVEPDPIGLRHMTNLAVNRWGLKRVEKVFFTGPNADEKP